MSTILGFITSLLTNSNITWQKLTVVGVVAVVGLVLYFGVSTNWGF